MTTLAISNIAALNIELIALGLVALAGVVWSRRAAQGL